MKEIKKATFVKGGGKSGGHTIRVPIPKQMADAIGLTKDSPTVNIELIGNQIIINKGEEKMKFYAITIETAEEFEAYIAENQPIKVDYHFGGYFFARPQKSVKKGEAAPPAARIDLEDFEVYEAIIKHDLKMTEEVEEGLRIYKEGEREMTKKERFEIMAEENGTVEFEGKEYALTQQAYLAGTHENPFYEALAIDEKGYEYIVRWEIVREAELEEDMCDWHAPASVEKL